MEKSLLELPPLVAGFDPGSSGGFAFLSKDLSFVMAGGMPETRKDFSDVLKEHAHLIKFAVIEKVRSSPQMGVVSAFTFGGNYERILMACTCLDIPFVEVTPGTWQKGLGLKKGTGLGLSNTEKKNDHKRAAQELFPKMKITHSIADALLIANHGRHLI